MQNHRSIFAAMILSGVALLLSGCAHQHHSTASTAAGTVVPQVPAADRESALSSNADDAKLIFRSKGMPMGVMYWTSESATQCAGFQPVGKVFDSGRDVLLPWIARMTESFNKGIDRTEVSREQILKPGTPIQVKGLTGASTPDGSPDTRYPYCGPLVTTFTPEKARTYLVEFVFNGTQSCSQRVSDITNPAKLAAVETQPLQCTPPKQGALQANTAGNFLKTHHEHNLDDARKDEAAAVSPSDKAFAMQREAAALDSLGRSDEALIVIDHALDILDPSKSKDLIATKAGILFNLNNPQGALNLLAPELERTRKFANEQPTIQRASALSTYTEGFITATFAYMQLEQWREAINTLVDAQSVLEGPSFYAYRSLVYRYIMARAKDSSLANPVLEQEATYYATHDKGHYGALLRMWQGEDTIREVAKIIAAMSGADQQEAFGEALFYGGAYARFVKGNEAGGRAMLDSLNRIAPYGSIEWIYGGRVLN
ncbi:tetratricopeptide repeat protein [Paraburkholderia antibiotica]|uniref:Tetratricopeptide repeat protein n=1 Tax=Paraburkholderia antibiotica TaxID=2728839 RepID=A0A7X9ZYI2_9BURK|nr:tetratricopeptide repeat protein [Paraburkholderia antibiotica]NML32841.1 tetratricopeptide repeat protein [Paraburkholderia antibiotica]